jgi:hypothetical protein
MAPPSICRDTDRSQRAVPTCTIGASVSPQGRSWCRASGAAKIEFCRQFPSFPRGACADVTAANMNCFPIRARIANSLLAKSGRKLRKERTFPGGSTQEIRPEGVYRWAESAGPLASQKVAKRPRRLLT